MSEQVVEKDWSASEFSEDDLVGDEYTAEVCETVADGSQTDGVE